MSNSILNVYRVEQRAFHAIPRQPWVYWIPDSLRRLFETLPALGDIARPVVGLQTGDNFRLLRCWWEAGRQQIAFGCRDAEEARETGKRWFPYMKGGSYRKWYGNQEYVVNWEDDGKEIRNFYKPSGRLASRPQNTDYYFREGVTWSDLSTKGFGVRYLPPGFVFDVKGSSGFPSAENLLTVLAVMNSPWIGFTLMLLNPTVSFQVGDISRVPFNQSTGEQRKRLEEVAQSAIAIRQWEAQTSEITFDFIIPSRWETGLDNLAAAQARLVDLEAKIHNEVYRLYGIDDADRAAIEAELAGEPLPTDEEEIKAILEDDKEEVEPPMDRQELAVRWISYAVGIVLGRFQPGVPGALGSAIYRSEDFAVGSLPAPSEEEFNELVGPPERFAYVDDEGGRHVFPAQVESTLQDLALADGIAVLDEGHECDLPKLVADALVLMLDTEAAQEVIAEGAKGDLRKFLEKDFFTKYHFKWYSVSRRKAPIYWPLQSADRSYGFVLFHERIGPAILYTLQRDYLDYKLNGLRARIGDLTETMERREGSERKAAARKVEELTATLTEIEAFARTIDRIVREGYEPAPNWIDDGVILRIAPLWELVPIWSSYPKRYWERLQEGEYDWSHIAMHYWPDRVRAACQENKSYAIAHGHPEWYEGG